MNWSTAFARQARADLLARDVLLQNRTLPQCHELHFLQMACEKLCKAYLMARPGSNPLLFQTSHGYIAKNLPIIIRQIISQQAAQLPAHSHVVEACRSLAKRIETLSPANDNAGTVPSNCEYPWTSAAGKIIIPAEFNFNLTLLYEKSGVTIIKLLRVAVDQLLLEEAI